MNDSDPSKRSPKEGWTGQVSWEQRFEDKRITIVAQPFLKTSTDTMRWAGLAIEAPAKADSLAEILANHSHADIGDFGTLSECLAACEKYIDHWLHGKIQQVACACTEIETAPIPA